MGHGNPAGDAARPRCGPGRWLASRAHLRRAAAAVLHRGGAHAGARSALRDLQHGAGRRAGPGHRRPRFAGRRGHLRRQHAARRRAAAGAGLRGPSVRPLHRPRRRAGDPAGRADHARWPPRGRAAEGIRADAVFPPRRRTRRPGTDASGTGHQRGDARARHPHVAQPGGRRHRRARVSRAAAARRRAHPRGGQPPAGRHVRMGGRASRRGGAARAGRLHRPPALPGADRRTPARWRCSTPSSSARPS